MSSKKTQSTSTSSKKTAGSSEDSSTKTSEQPKTERPKFYLSHWVYGTTDYPRIKFANRWPAWMLRNLKRGIF